MIGETELRTVLDSLDEGLHIIDVIFDENDNPTDLFFVMSNPAADRIVGSNFTGKRIRDIEPAFTEKWLKSFGIVARTGKSMRMEAYVPPHQKWIGFYLFKIGGEGSHRIVSAFQDITERKQWEEDLQRSEQMLKIVLDQFPGVVFWKDLDLRYLGGNREAARIAGFKDSSEYEGKTDHDMPWAKTEADAYRADDRAVIESGRPKLHKIERQLRANGEIGWLDTSKVPLRDAQGNVIGILGTSTDITELKRTEDALKQSEERQAFLLKLSDALRPLDDPLEIKNRASCVLGKQLNASRVAYGEVEANNTYITFESNYTVPDVAGMNGRYRIADYGRSIVRSLNNGLTIVIPNVAEAAELSEEERARYRKMDIASLIRVPLNKGERLVAQLVVQYHEPRQWNESEIEMVEETAERTWAAVERARAEQALRESEKRLRLHIENAPTAVVEWDNEFIVTMWAGTAERMFGWSADETIGRSIMELNIIYPEDIPIVERTILNLRISQGDKVVSSNRNFTKDGRVIYCTWYNTVMKDEKGVMTSVLSIVVDDTDRVRAEKELKRSNAELQNFAYITSHDLREPLRMVSSYLDLLEHRYKNKVLDEKGQEYIDYAVDGATRMRHMIDDLLVYSRIETREKPFTEVDMNDVFTIALKDLSSSIKNN
ncbi:MAG: PAS domain S-box protein, partial [Candidatus Saccharibacteria bacterium]